MVSMDLGGMIFILNIINYHGSQQSESQAQSLNEKKKENVKLSMHATF